MKSMPSLLRIQSSIEMSRGIRVLWKRQKKPKVYSSISPVISGSFRAIGTKYF